MNFDEALQIAEAYVNEKLDPIVLAIVKESTIELEFGWCFFTEGRDFRISGNPSDMVAGNGPFLVEKSTGKVFQFGTARPTEFYIRLYQSGVLSPAY